MSFLDFLFCGRDEIPKDFYGDVYTHSNGTRTLTSKGFRKALEKHRGNVVLMSVNNISRLERSERCMIEHQFDILRRCLDRAQEYFFKKEDSPGVDHIEHIRNELELLKREIYEERN